MATKTLSVDLEAYERLRRARVHEKESFSRVIKRALWLPSEGTAAEMLDLVRARGDSAGALSKDELDRLDELQEEEPAPNRWAEVEGEPS
jgi:predicted CopG family antitoxin